MNANACTYGRCKDFFGTSSNSFTYFIPLDNKFQMQCTKDDELILFSVYKANSLVLIYELRIFNHEQLFH
ncbi:hypothetical protein T02_14532 [Trichinella nativa]|uniref:Uncharacterized protein n=1 Tax=Trichinella nativa TaxID=6335 RepID=A0A0V1KZ10_9BILA|nr:hypothetical protein T02_14532 [Trichinella nativa]